MISSRRPGYGARVGGGARSPTWRGSAEDGRRTLGGVSTARRPAALVQGNLQARPVPGREPGLESGSAPPASWVAGILGLSRATAGYPHRADRLGASSVTGALPLALIAAVLVAAQGSCALAFWLPRGARAGVRRRVILRAPPMGELALSTSDCAAGDAAPDRRPLLYGWLTGPRSCGWKSKRRAPRNRPARGLPEVVAGGLSLIVRRGSRAGCCGGWCLPLALPLVLAQRSCGARRVA